MKTALYLRKSRSDDPADTVEQTLSCHKKILLDFARENELDISDDSIFEEVVSGESLYKRTQMLRLLSLIEEKEYYAVLCMDIDRLGRGAMSDQGIILETFKKSGTLIITPQKIYDLNNDIDEEMTEFQSFMARRELKMINKRLHRGIIRTVKEGGYTANAPYGYTKSRIGKLPSLQIELHEAAFVRLAYNMYLDGMGCTVIADTLNSLGAMPRRASRFSRTSVANILHNPVYAGNIIYHRHDCGKEQGNPSGDISVNGIHPAIIQQEDFDRVQQMFVNKGGKSHPCGTVNVLAGLVICADCGSLMQRQCYKKGGEYLICTKKGCNMSSKLNLVEEQVLSLLKKTSQGIYIKVSNADTESDNSEALLLNDESKRLIQQKQRLHELLERGIYDEATYLERLDSIEHREKAIKARYEEYSKKISFDKTEPGDSLFSIMQIYDMASNRGKNALLSCFFEKISYKREKGADHFELKAYLKPPAFALYTE